jgi:hypothetical protein
LPGMALSERGGHGGRVGRKFENRNQKFEMGA